MRWLRDLKDSERLSLLVCEPKDLFELFPTPVMAEGLLDRLLNSAYMITMLGRSYRPQQRPGTSTSTASTNGGDLQLANHREHTTGNKR